MFYYLWEKMHNIHTNICMKMDDIPYKIKRMPFCFEWKTLCWTILRLHDALQYIIQSWCFIIMIIVVLMLRFAWVHYLEKNMDSIRIRISTLNKDLVNLHIKVLRLKTTQSILGTLGVTNYLTDIDSENDDPKISEHDSATSQSLPMHGFITQFLKSDDKERHAFLEVWSNFVAQEKKKMENKQDVKRVASEITLPTHLYMRVPTPNLMLSTYFDPTELTQTQFEPERFALKQAEINYITPSVYLRSPCRSKSMIQKDSETMHSTGLRNHRMDQAKRLGLDPKENMYEQSCLNGGRCFSEMPRRNIYNFQNREYVHSNFYVPPLFPYKLHEMKNGTNVNVGKNNKNNVNGVNRKEKCKPIKNNNNNNNRNNNDNNSNRNDINSRNNSIMNRGRPNTPNRFNPVNQTYTVRWNY